MNTENEEKGFIGQVDQVQIDAWKEKYKTRKINFAVTEDSDGKKHITYFKQPSFDHLSILTANAKKNKELDGLKTIFNDLRIGGSDEVPADYHMHFSAIQSVGELLKATKGTLGKL